MFLPQKKIFVLYQIAPGEYRPALVVNAWNDNSANLLVFPDGTNDGIRPLPADIENFPVSGWLSGMDFTPIWRISVCHGNEPGQFIYPEEAVAEGEFAYEYKKCEEAISKFGYCQSVKPSGAGASLAYITATGAMNPCNPCHQAKPCVTFSPEKIKPKDASPDSYLKVVGRQPGGPVSPKEGYTISPNECGKAEDVLGLKGPGGGGPSGCGGNPPGKPE